MKITPHTILSNKPPIVKIIHKDEILDFTVSVFGKDSFQNQEFCVFYFLNKYWEQLPEETLDKIFSVYKDIHEAFWSIHNRTELTTYLKEKSVELLDIHNLDKLQHWVQIKSEIMVPSSFSAEYEHSIDHNTSREKSYTRSDYIKLVTMSLAFRVMIPIWGEYINAIRSDVGPKFKEFFSFQLIQDSPIMKSVPMIKLITYIEHIVGPNRNNATNTIEGISSEDFPAYLLALICIRKLCTGDIRGLNPSAHLVTFIYMFILQKIDTKNATNDKVVRPKLSDDRTSNEENKTSTLERYKIKTNISIGEIVELEYSMRDVRGIAYRLSPLVDPAILERSLETCQALASRKLTDPQITLLRWVFKPVISPKGILYLPNPMVVNALGVLEAVLWARGHKYLALLSTSHPVTSDHAMIVSPVDSKMRVSQELKEELDRYYPYTRPANQKKLNSEEINLAAKAIDDLADDLTKFSWRPTAHEDMLVEAMGTKSRRFPIKPDIKNDLTRLVIEIASRTSM